MLDTSGGRTGGSTPGSAKDGAVLLGAKNTNAAERRRQGTGSVAAARANTMASVCAHSVCILGGEKAGNLIVSCLRNNLPILPLNRVVGGDEVA